MTYLFLGGPLDGERRRVEDGIEVLRVCTPMPLPTYGEDWDAAPKAFTIPNEEYHRTRIHSKSDGAWIFYTHGSRWPLYDVISRLMLNYKKP